MAEWKQNRLLVEKALLVTLLQVHKLLLLLFFKFLQVKSIPNRIAFTANAKRLVSFYHVTTHYFCLRVHY